MGVWVFEGIKFLKENGIIIKDNWFLFVLFAIICFCLSWAVAKKYYQREKVKYSEYKKMKERVDELVRRNEKLEKQIRDLATTERMLVKQRVVKQEDSMGKKIADAISKN